MPLSVPKKRDDIYTTIYDDNKLGVYCVAWEVIMNPAEAEDIAMAAFEYLIRWPKKLYGYAPYQTTAYLKRISKCRALDRWRELNSGLSYAQNVKDTWDAKKPMLLEDQMLLKFGKEAVKEAVNSLPHVYNVSIRFELSDGLNCKQISEIMGVKHSAVRKRLQRARQMIRDYLYEKYADKKEVANG